MLTFSKNMSSFPRTNVGIFFKKGHFPCRATTNGLKSKVKYATLAAAKIEDDLKTRTKKTKLKIKNDIIRIKGLVSFAKKLNKDDYCFKIEKNN